jgi:GDP-mannose 4,6 dehydratase
VDRSNNQPELTADVAGLQVLRVFESIHKHSPRSKFLQPSSSEMFGKVTESRSLQGTRRSALSLVLVLPAKGNRGKNTCGSPHSRGRQHVVGAENPATTDLASWLLGSMTATLQRAVAAALMAFGRPDTMPFAQSDDGKARAGELKHRPFALQLRNAVGIRGIDRLVLVEQFVYRISVNRSLRKCSGARRPAWRCSTGRQERR